MVNGCYKKQALASKDEGPAEIGRAAAAGRGRARIDLAVAACLFPLPRSRAAPPHCPRTQADITGALAPSPPATSERDAHHLPATRQRNHTPFSCIEDRVTGFSNSIYSAIEKLSRSR